MILISIIIPVVIAIFLAIFKQEVDSLGRKIRKEKFKSFMLVGMCILIGICIVIVNLLKDNIL